jgi:hypothetical protein
VGIPEEAEESKQQGGERRDELKPLDGSGMEIADTKVTITTIRLLHLLLARKPETGAEIISL